MTEAKISVIEDKKAKQEIARGILERLPEWFGIPEAREEYIAQSAEQIMMASFAGEMPTGFCCLKETGKDTAELYVMGVLKDFHRKGIGRQIFTLAKEIAVTKGYSFLQVKTVQSGRYPEYDDTNLFYRSLGFQELEVFPELWGEANPCQIYIMYIGET